MNMYIMDVNINGRWTVFEFEANNIIDAFKMLVESVGLSHANTCDNIMKKDVI